MNKYRTFLSLTLFLLLVTSGAYAQKPSQPSWLSDAVFYQIYPSSFQDSNGDGYGARPHAICVASSATRSTSRR